MPTYQFEAMDPQGQEIKDVIDAPTQDEAQTTIRSMGYFVTKISVQKAPKGAASSSGKGRKTFALGGAGGKKMVTFRSPKRCRARPRCLIGFTST